MSQCWTASLTHAPADPLEESILPRPWAPVTHSLRYFSQQRLQQPDYPCVVAADHEPHTVRLQAPGLTTATYYMRKTTSVMILFISLKKKPRLAYLLKIKDYKYQFVYSNDNPLSCSGASMVPQ